MTIISNLLCKEISPLHFASVEMDVELIHFTYKKSKNNYNKY